MVDPDRHRIVNSVNLTVILTDLYFSYGGIVVVKSIHGVGELPQCQGLGSDARLISAQSDSDWQTVADNPEYY